MGAPDDKHEKHVDPLTGIETTGHEWDGVRELNVPSPQWWLIMVILGFIWGGVYMVLYPSWPSISGEGNRGAYEGTLGWTSYKQLEESAGEIEAIKAEYAARFANASYDAVRNDAGLYEFALVGGEVAFKDNCAVCHGTGGAGGPGYPNLNDDFWLWGGTMSDIERTLRYGIRSGHDEARVSEMPAFSGMISNNDINDVAEHVLSLSGQAEVNANGAKVFADQCAFCHGAGGEGSQEVGAPNLADAIWHFGSGAAAIKSQIRAPKHGIMPSWEGRLDDATIRQLTLYVHSLGGGVE